MTMLNFKRAIKYSDLIAIAKLLSIEPIDIYTFDPYGKIEWDMDEQFATTISDVKILFNFGDELMRFKEFELSDFDHIIDFSEKMISAPHKSYQLNLIQAPNGHARYIFQKGDRSMRVLDFLPSISLKAKIKKGLLKTVLKLNKVNWVGKSFQILSTVKPYFIEQTENVMHDSFAVFLGTPGHHRKPVVQVSTKGVATNYLKLANSTQTYNCIEAEKINLKRLSNLDLKQMNIPITNMNQSAGILIQKAIDRSNKTNSSTLTEQHIEAVLELTEVSLKYKKLSDTDFYEDVVEQMYTLKGIKSENLFNLSAKLNALKTNIYRHQYVYTAINHGDFTPWNVAVGEDVLQVFDWEMTRFDAPVLYDLFHFIYQSELLVNRNGLRGVEKEIKRMFNHPQIKDFTFKHKVNIERCHHLYLLDVIGKNIILFDQQANLSLDHIELLNGWQEALSNFNFPNLETDCRREFLIEFQADLLPKNYVALKYFLNQFSDLPLNSDLDFAIAKDEIESVLKFVKSHELVAKCVIVKKSFMSTAQIHFINGAFLSVDLIHDFVRKGRRYLNCLSVLYHSRLVNGVRLPALVHDLAYTQHFYTLNKTAMPLKYQQIFAEALFQEGAINGYLDMFRNNYDLRATNIFETFDFSTEKLIQTKRFLRYQFNRNIFKGFYRKLQYLNDLRIDITANRGFMVTFSGVDGAGKTTIISEVKQQFEQKYRKKVVLLRHRPGILPILSAAKYGGKKNAEERAGTQLPRKGTNKSTLSSFLRFSYYYTDYILGQFYVYFKYILKGKVVIYDRYYFDFINDAKRSNIQLNRRFTKYLYRLIYKADFNFYLYNDAETILKRKQELNAADINQLNERYNTLFVDLKSSRNEIYMQVKNDKKSVTVGTIFKAINKTA